MEQESIEQKEPATAAELTQYIQSLLVDMQQKFQETTESVLKRLDDMNTKITSLETSVAEMMEQTGTSEDKI
ncbi:putative heat shock factor-binding protein 1 [Monocercomonoides exilis]|uniref:putative heat shock factor-binding protein 1 n=1 Tax=Monocercomonoides exilis TaxID=2049356 RepID=UPI0035594D57|nr:putative heat shock factor-binding protein 1 [Monocercomonoides exilis]|eukprot:MONOS_5933.1-p1 / transcript=MONOS_5933.1 / gene=MONOS_5933 / organism=Monocercomonoides_exilis_PA203 / gene_product=unspecified product / transcript_product=unspecified product / location=Mono_scaffold00179:31263-31621(-) / protein_length=71 / sequence_SO=supercontig / SO=protein_coding / is_pseudo=false